MWIETMSVRGVMIRATVTSPNSITPSIISRASSSSSPSRSPSLTIVRISSSNDSSVTCSTLRPLIRRNSRQSNSAPHTEGASSSAVAFHSDQLCSTNESAHNRAMPVGSQTKANHRIASPANKRLGGFQPGKSGRNALDRPHPGDARHDRRERGQHLQTLGAERRPIAKRDDLAE